MIKVFPVRRRLEYSPFTSESEIQYLRSQEIIISPLKQADLIVAATFKRILPLILKYRNRKKFLIWTNEPRFATYFDSIVKYPLLPKLNILNVYTGIYTQNYMWVPTNIKLTPLTEFEFKNRKVVALMQYRNNLQKWSFKYKRKELDLCYLRTQIGLEGHKLNMFDVYGKFWPKHLKKGEPSPGKKRRQEKLEILQNYHFNLAFENTNWPYYCTEKIWDSIQGGCLPIYYGEDNAIYEDFPQNSFLDYCQFGDAGELFRYIQLMTPQEFIKRMNLCIEAFNIASKNREDTGMSPLNIEATVNKIREIF
ncbi:MAG: glycosyltransferase family 10 [Microcoleaceae cyanobacterium MO_207.B10]|nr:glycosyltransferase family 10 [Microcoleaceae cyanobacterium MO_207.B10]